MRSLITLAAAGLVAACVGCCHTAGYCDCDRPEDPCCYGPTGTGLPGGGGYPTPPPIEAVPAPVPQKDAR